ncbi:uncharacterized protein LOC113235737 isoform X2 [Hyposmocoma kahamanoa]|uniref:uncharacterized protein LOC113235737 isoform X2 n=1 Tax=Hyposmocoma kahamanoa TaxID=1477025 RepID=UPI000E6D9800|nr:uncharacterized protein LOC113235737 isoform X2 [Hyposmocoma kahamanoa]
MDSMSYNFNMDEQKPIFTTASDTKVTRTTETFAPSPPSDTRTITSQSENVFSQLGAQYQDRNENDLLTLMGQQEPRVGDTAPSTADIDMMNFRMNGSDMMFDDVGSTHNFYVGGSRAESVVSSNTNMWTDSGVSSGRNNETIDTFDFLVKSLTSANNYVSMLTREQLSVLRSIRPGLLYEFLQEVAKLRSEKRMRRALPNECAFCKNNGENEECYTTHMLKDWRGRVLCPVLRAFRCPRCGATGDRAHTIKYCPDNTEAGSDRMGLASRRRVQPPASLLLSGASMGQNGLPAGLRTPQPGGSGPPAPSPQPATAPLSHSSLWSTFGMN